MSNVRSRLSRIEKLLESADCICGSPVDAVPILVVENHWSQERIQAEETKLVPLCAVHGAQRRLVLRLSGSDING